ncbi:MAG: hypothetical protein LQ351_007227 [Letrouitia transgressa]|nr:MAG: hypothetical protein LQ351_007227 [Letrouitia transgressa]
MTLTNPTVDKTSNQWFANDSNSLQQGVISYDGHKPESEQPQLYHGPFSQCCCKSCLEDAKREAEKRLSDESLAFGYIKKLEGMVNSLQLQIGDDEGTFGFVGPVELSSPFREDPGSSKDDNGPRARIVRMKKIWDPLGGEPKVERDRTQTAPGSVPANLKNESVLSVFREFDRRKNYWRRFLEIRSPPFIELLRGMVDSDIDISSPDEVLGLKEPWMLLFHNRTNLLQYLQEDAAGESSPQTKTAKEHTKLILDFMQNECPEASNKLDDLQSKNCSGLITYDLAWLLYPPGSVVYSKDTGEYEAFVVESIRGCQRHQPAYNSRHSHSSIELTCWSINYDGEIFGRVWSTHYLSPFEGTKDITSLPLIPEAFLPDVDLVKESLVDRGEKFWSLQGQCFREYTGEVWSSHMNEDPIRVMVDHLTYQRRQNWPIEIDRKRGPAGAQSKNWRENKFTRRDRHRNPAIYSPAPPLPRPMRPRPTHLIHAHGDNEDYNPDQYIENDHYAEPYERHECDRPPQAEKVLFKKYDSLRPDSKPDTLTALLSPQAVHGYCLRDKVWSKSILQYIGKQQQ